jgi:xanthine/CO dehydrogenase XdhC/CoxF family maturation factor
MSRRLLSDGTTLMKGAASLFSFVIEASARGAKTTLITITNVIGQSFRVPGTHGVVTEGGAFRHRGITPVSPVGLIPTTRDPETRAMSILSQVADVYRDAVRTFDDIEPDQPSPEALCRHGRILAHA